MTTPALDRRAGGSELLDGRYRLGAVIGQGGYARVHRATDESLGREVAVKLFTVETPDGRDLLRRQSETRLLAALNHASLVTLFDARLDTDPAYLVMELIDGPTLRSVLSDAPMSPRTAARLATELGEALQVIHGAGVVHRDIKPSNVLMRPAALEGGGARATLTDFGIASLVDSTRLTATGTLVGTAAYLSPEQARGQSAGPASDVYSLGLLLIEALTGERAFPQNTPIEALAARIARPPVIPPELPADWRALLSAMTALQPEHRPDAAAVTRAAQRLQNSDAAAGAIAPTRAPAAALSTQALSTQAMTATAPEGALVETKRMDAAAEPAATKPTIAFDSVPASTPPPLPSSSRRVPRWAWWVGIVVVIGIAAIVAGIAWSTGSAPSPAPSFPPLPEPLSTHFGDLWETL